MNQKLKKQKIILRIAEKDFNKSDWKLINISLKFKIV